MHTVQKATQAQEIADIAVFMSIFIITGCVLGCIAANYLIEKEVEWVDVWDAFEEYEAATRALENDPSNSELKSMVEELERTHRELWMQFRHTYPDINHSVGEHFVNEDGEVEMADTNEGPNNGSRAAKTRDIMEYCDSLVKSQEV